MWAIRVGTPGQIPSRITLARDPRCAALTFSLRSPLSSSPCGEQVQGPSKSLEFTFFERKSTEKRCGGDAPEGWGRLLTSDAPKFYDAHTDSDDAVVRRVESRAEYPAPPAQTSAAAHGIFPHIAKYVWHNAVFCQVCKACCRSLPYMAILCVAFCRILPCTGCYLRCKHANPPVRNCVLRL